MQINRQTIWLVTMLTLMVALSAYYIITGPVEPASPLTGSEGVLKDGQVQVDTKPVTQIVGRKKESAVSEYFVYQNLHRQTVREKLMEDYYKVLADPTASKEKLEEAERNLNNLTKVDKTEEVMENLLRKDGFRDAVVLQNKKRVDILVQSEQLSNEQVVKILDLAKQQLGVSPEHVSVRYRP